MRGGTESIIGTPSPPAGSPSNSSKKSRHTQSFAGTGEYELNANPFFTELAGAGRLPQGLREDSLGPRSAESRLSREYIFPKSSLPSDVLHETSGTPLRDRARNPSTDVVFPLEHPEELNLSTLAGPVSAEARHARRQRSKDPSTSGLLELAEGNDLSTQHSIIGMLKSREGADLSPAGLREHQRTKCPSGLLEPFPEDSGRSTQAMSTVTGSGLESDAEAPDMLGTTTRRAPGPGPHLNIFLSAPPPLPIPPNPPHTPTQKPTPLLSPDATTNGRAALGANRQSPHAQLAVNGSYTLDEGAAPGSGKGQLFDESDSGSELGLAPRLRRASLEDSNRETAPGSGNARRASFDNSGISAHSSALDAKHQRRASCDEFNVFESDQSDPAGIGPSRHASRYEAERFRRESTNSIPDEGALVTAPISDVSENRIVTMIASNQWAKDFLFKGFSKEEVSRVQPCLPSTLPTLPYNG